MKLTIDFEQKTISVEGEAPLSELTQKLEKHLPNWKKFKLIQHTQYQYYPWYVYPNYPLYPSGPCTWMDVPVSVPYVLTTGTSNGNFAVTTDNSVLTTLTTNSDLQYRDANWFL